jgi:hypothetical protein
MKLTDVPMIIGVLSWFSNSPLFQSELECVCGRPPFVVKTKLGNEWKQMSLTPSNKFHSPSSQLTETILISYTPHAIEE